MILLAGERCALGPLIERCSWLDCSGICAPGQVLAVVGRGWMGHGRCRHGIELN